MSGETKYRVVREMKELLDTSSHAWINEVYQIYYDKMRVIPEDDFGYPVVNSLAKEFYRDLYKAMPDKTPIEELFKELPQISVALSSRMKYDTVRWYMITKHDVPDFRFV